MKHTYNNWSSNLFDGFYNSNLEPNYYLLQDMAENDIAEGIIKEGQTYDITGDNYTQYEKDVASHAVDCLVEILPNRDIIKDMTFKELYSPQYYNYETDSLIIDMDLNLKALKTFCFKEHATDFNKYLKENFTSYDGFISFIDNNIRDFIDTYETSTCNDREINVMIEYYLLSCIYESFDSKDFEYSETYYHNRLYDCVSQITLQYYDVVELV